jgi:hypothetical protein
MIETTDLSSLATAIALLAKANPITAIASGIITSIFGGYVLGKKQSHKQKKKTEDDLQKILDLKISKIKE